MPCSPVEVSGLAASVTEGVRVEAAVAPAASVTTSGTGVAVPVKAGSGVKSTVPAVRSSSYRPLPGTTTTVPSASTVAPAGALRRVAAGSSGTSGSPAVATTGKVCAAPCVLVTAVGEATGCTAVAKTALTRSRPPSVVSLVVVVNGPLIEVSSLPTRETP